MEPSTQTAQQMLYAPVMSCAIESVPTTNLFKEPASLPATEGMSHGSQVTVSECNQRYLNEDIRPYNAFINIHVTCAKMPFFGRYPYLQTYIHQEVPRP